MTTFVAVTGLTLTLTADIVGKRDCIYVLNSADVIIDGGGHTISSPAGIDVINMHDTTGINISNLVLDGGVIAIYYDFYQGSPTTNIFSNIKAKDSLSPISSIGVFTDSDSASLVSFVVQDSFFGRNCFAYILRGNNAVLKNSTFLGANIRAESFGEGLAAFSSLTGDLEVSGNRFTESAFPSVYATAASAVVRDNSFTNMAFTACMNVVSVSTTTGFVQINNNFVCYQLLVLFLTCLCRYRMLRRH